MSYPFDSRLGEQLYRLLPEVYRTRDRQADSGDDDTVDHSLARYLDAHGVLLDLIHATVEQQLRDALPGSSQEWLLPYWARLVATDIVSPDAEGKHAEVSNAIAWRQRKGTLKCAEEIAEAVGRMEVELQEGWKRVIMTPRVGMPLIPFNAVDDSLDLDMGLPHEATQHPALSAATIDLRRPSRAVEALSSNPAAKNSAFGGIRQTWRQANRHGVPCFPGSYEDVSRRTVDIRTPDETNGRYHHKRVLLFAPPPTGFFTLKPESMTWAERLDSIHEHLIEEAVEAGITVIRNRTERIIEITDDVTLDAKPYRIEGIHFLRELKVLSGGKLELSGVEAGKVSVETFSIDEPVLTASDCLFGELSSAGLVQLDSCTVLGNAYMTSVGALDCIFMAILGMDITGSLEYCRISDDAPLSADRNKMAIKSHRLNGDSEYLPVTDVPSFIPGQTALAARAVLSPNAPESICAGASDSGEMGYYHRGRRNRPVHITKAVHFSPPSGGGYPLEDVIFDHGVKVSDGQLILRRSAAPKLTVTTSLNGSGEVIPSLTATDCLFQSIDVSNGLARLEYCTVMKKAKCKHLQASDCIFAGTIDSVTKQSAGSQVKAFMNCLRYSSVPSHLDKSVARALRLADSKGGPTLGTNTLVQPVFGEFRFCGEDKPRKAKYGEWGCGVLSPHTPRAVRFGAEDGGEMGAYHHRHYALKAEAMLAKIREFLPVGIEPALIEDERLLHLPPEETNS